MTPPALQSPPKVWTEDEFLAHFDRGYELVDGVVVEVPMPGFEHGKALVRFILALGNFVEIADCGHVVCNDTLVRISDRPLTLLGPDVAYFSYDRLPKSECPKGAAPVVPELAVEARSPSVHWGYVLDKVERYLNVGVTAVAVLDADTKTVAVYRAGMTQEVFGVGQELVLPDILPNFAVAVERLYPH